ncbi:uncharacterized protein EI90DRAFT_3042994, partial [Cantharellus anzutake]|uniref:uncharacterized protein n=1 Tax=Cantharellus anzutake TaxID=1750568 RepID=UPI001907F4FC
MLIKFKRRASFLWNRSPSETTRLQPFPGLFPFDIICLIIKFCDPRERRALSLTCRAYHAQASKLVWRRIAITNTRKVDAIGALLRASSLIRQNPACAKHVQRLDVELQRTKKPHLRLHSKAKVRLALDELCRALESLPSLRTLYIRMEKWHDELAHLLSSNATRFPFHLTSFGSSMYITDGLGGFLTSQTTIKTFFRLPKASSGRFGDHIPRGSMDIKHGALPALRQIWTHPDALIESTRGRPLHWIGSPIASPRHVAALLGAIQVSSAKVRHVSVCICATLRDVYESLLTSLANIDSLSTITLSLWGVDSKVDGVLVFQRQVTAVLRQISNFPALRKMEVGGSDPAFLTINPTAFCPRTMKVVEVYDYSGASGKRFRRRKAG